MKYNLPDSWVLTTIEQICSPPQYGWTTSASPTGKIKLLRTTDISSGKVNWSTVPYCKKPPEDFNKYELKPDDIVISRAGSVGLSYLIKKPLKSVFASYLIRFKPLINVQYVKYFLESPSYWNAISERKLGIAVPNVNATKIKQIEIPIAPLPEQKRIVAKIEKLFTKLDAGVDALKKAKILLKRYRQSVLKSAMEGKLTAKWREENKDKIEPASELLKRILAERRAKWETDQLAAFKAKGKKPKDDSWKKKYKEPEPPDTTDLPELPEGWVWISVGHLGTSITGSTPKTSKREYYDNGMYPFYRPAELNNGYNVNTSEIKLSDEGLLVSRKIPKNTVMVTCIGATIGKTGVCRKEGATNQQINSILGIDSIIVSEYCFFIFNTHFMQNQIIENSSSTTLPILNKTKFDQLRFPICTINEQKAIVKEIEKQYSILDRLESEIIDNVIYANKLRRSILKVAFSGKSVEQNPEDGSAEELLEQIKG